MMTFVEAAFDEFARAHSDLFGDRRALVSVSGGVDSMVLLEILRRYRQRHPSLQLEAIHFNFGLRGEESERDERLVRSYCEAHEIPLQVFRAGPAPEQGKQAWAREWRLSILRESAADFIFEGHHQNDQVETFLFRLFRGSGLKGLSSIRERTLRESKLVLRPFLKIPKQEILNFAASEKIPSIQDSSNQTTDYARNWLRHEILPRLDERFPGVFEKIAAAVHEIQGGEDFLSEILRARLSDLRSRMLKPDLAAEGTWIWPRDEMRALEPLILKRLIREWFQEEVKMTLDREKLEALVDFIKGQAAFSMNAPRQLQIRSGERDAWVRLRFLSKSTIQEAALYDGELRIK